MRVRVGFLLVVAVQLLALPAALASEAWKDGCPAFFPTDNVPNYVFGVPANAGPGSFGILPELDSPLGSTRVAHETWVTQLTEAQGGRPNKLVAGQALVQLDLPKGPIFALKVSGGRALRGANEDAYSHLGNIQGFVGYRFSSYLIEPLARIATAIRLGGGGTALADDDQAEIDQRQQMAALSAFRAPLFGFDRPFTLTLEERIELIGCHAPFIDFRIDGTTWQTQVAGLPVRVYDLPIEIAGGGYFLPWAAAYLAVGVDLRKPESTLLYSYLVRTRLGAELQFCDHRLRIGLQAGGIVGGNTTGYEASLTFSVGFKKDGIIE